MKKRGFTLIELLIVIVVIAILALIVIPKLMGASRAAKESTLAANVQQIRSALAQFQADTGVYPTNLGDIVFAATTGTTVGSTTVPANSYKGPYLTPSGGIPATTGAGIPQNPFIASATDGTIVDHWTYTSASGTVISAIAGTTVAGVAYTAL